MATNPTTSPATPAAANNNNAGPGGSGAITPSKSKDDTDASKTITETIVGEHEHVIVGYSLLKGIGDGEPIASDRFVVGGHQWVLLFYPDGKKSSAEGAHHHHQQLLGHYAAANIMGANWRHDIDAAVNQITQDAADAAVRRGARDAAANNDAPVDGAAQDGRGRAAPQAGLIDDPPHPRDPRPQAGAARGLRGGYRDRGDATRTTPVRDAMRRPITQRDERSVIDRTHQERARVMRSMLEDADAGMQAAIGGRRAPGNLYAGMMRMPIPQQLDPMPMGHIQMRGRDDARAEIQYAALFVALIGETSKPLGVVQTSEGHVVRAFHHFTLVDQSGRGRDITKGRRREQGAVKISCARQDPNARNCHGYRKFIRRSLLENQDLGYLMNDTIVIRYKIELVVMSGGAFSRNDQEAALPIVEIPRPNISEDLASILHSGENSDFSFVVEGESMPAHRLIVASRSPVFKALLDSNMREGIEETVHIHDVRAPAFRLLLHFVYTDCLPPDFSGENLEVTMAQHLLAAADRFELPRLRAICEKHLCETVDVENAATTLALAEENHASELKRHCLDFVASNLSQVMSTSGFEYMIQRCPELQRSILQACSHGRHESKHGGRSRDDVDHPGSSSGGGRRVRFRLK